MVNYWDRLQPEMEAKGMNIPRLAKELGISFNAVAKVRDGGEFGSINNLKAAKLFNLNPEWLATGKGPKMAKPETPLLERSGKQEVAVNDVPPFGQTLQGLAHHLSNVDASKREAAISVMTALMREPENLEFLSALTTLLVPAAFVYKERNAA